MRRWKTLVVEDEQLTREHICQLLESDPEIELVGSCARLQEAIQLGSQSEPDLLLLDIHLPDGQGFQLLEHLSHTPVLVFITAYDRYAIRAFEERAVDYLLKPFDRARFFAAIERAKHQLTQAQFGQSLEDLRSLATAIALPQATGRASAAEKLDQIALKSSGRTILQRIDEISWIEAANSRVLVHLGAGSIPVSESLTSLEGRLSGLGFVRVHRGSLVNLRAIAEIQSWFHGDYLLILKDGARVKLSRRYRAQFEACLGSSL